MLLAQGVTNAAVAWSHYRIVMLRITAVKLLLSHNIKSKVQHLCFKEL